MSRSNIRPPRGWTREDIENTKVLKRVCGSGHKKHKPECYQFFQRSTSDPDLVEYEPGLWRNRRDYDDATIPETPGQMSLGDAV